MPNIPHHRLRKTPGCAQVSPHRLAEPCDVLYNKRLIQAVLRAQVGLGLRGTVFRHAEVDVNGIALHQVEEKEEEHGGQERGEQDVQQTSDNVPLHVLSGQDAETDDP